MPFVRKIEIETGIIGIWKITESADSLFAAFQFSENEDTEFNKFIIDKRRIEYLATRLLLQQLLNKKNEIVHEKSGRPLIKNSNLNISISHSADFVVIFISNHSIGIDVENVNRKIDRVTNRFLHPDELAWVKKSGNLQSLKILLWCAKEAIFKCSCQAGVQFDTQIYVSPFDFEKSNFFKGKLTTINGEENFNMWYFHEQNNIAVYCVEVKRNKL